MTWSAAVRTILGEYPHTLEHDTPANIREDVTSAICVEVAGLGHALYSPDTGRAMFTQGPGTEREVDVARSTDGTVEVTLIKNGSGQRRMVVLLRQQALNPG